MPQNVEGTIFTNMEDANSIVPAEVRIDTTTISYGLHHGEPVPGKPIFLLVAGLFLPRGSKRETYGLWDKYVK